MQTGMLSNFSNHNHYYVQPLWERDCIMSNFWLADVITGVYTSFAPWRVRPHERIQEFLKGVGEPGGGGRGGEEGLHLNSWRHRCGW